MVIDIYEGVHLICTRRIVGGGGLEYNEDKIYH